MHAHRENDVYVQNHAWTYAAPNIMQHLGNNVPQGPGLIEKSFIPFDLDYLESCGSNNNKACDDQGLCNDLQNCVPASMNLSNNGGFPFVWNNVSGIQRPRFETSS